MGRNKDSGRDRNGSSAGAVCVGFLLGVLFFLRGYLFTAEAAPAVLSTESAVVYEQTSETSAPVGNLVQGGSFEYLGDVTAEDGSVWHAVTMPGGAAGYIKGDAAIEQRSTEAQQADPAQGEETGAEGAEAGEAAAQAETGREEEATPQEAAVQEPEDGETAGENTGEEIPGETQEAMEQQPVQTVQNNRQKTYASQRLGQKLKETGNTGESLSATEKEEWNVKKGAGRYDITFILCIVTALVSAVAACFFTARLRGNERKTKKHTLTGSLPQKSSQRSGKKKRKSKRRKNKRNGRTRE